VLINYQKYDLGYIDGLIPYEREIYLAMLADYLEKELQKELNGS
jgi:hypothetical protein